MYLSAAEPAAAYARYRREELFAGDAVRGPAVITEHTATTVVHAGDVLRVGSYGELVVTLGEIAMEQNP